MILSLLSLAGATGTLAPPAVDAQLWRLPADASSTLWADDAGIVPGAQARVAAGWMHDPVVWVFDDTGEKVSIVEDAVGFDVVAGWGVGPARIAVDVPVWPWAGGAQGGGTGLGDLAIDGKVRVLPAGGPVGLAVTGRVALPTSGEALPLGAPGVGWELALVGDAAIGPVKLALNLGTRGVPDVALENVDVSDRGVARLGVGYAIGDRAGVSLDLSGQMTWSEPGNAAGAPVEALLGGWLWATDTVSVRAGVGKGLSRGIGAPSARAVLALGWEPSRAQAAPRPATPRGAAVAKAEPAPTKPTSKPTATSRKAEPEAMKAVRIGDPQGLAPGLVHLRVRTANGQDAAPTWSLGGQKAGTLTDGRGLAEVAPGSWRLVIEATGYAPIVQMVEVETGLTSAVDVTLQPSRVTVTSERFALVTPLRFHGAALAPDNNLLLSEIAAILRARPEIIGVRIEGYASRSRVLEQDLTMSGLRAAAVKDWLVEAGVEPERLVTAGYGSGRPLDPANPSDPRNDRVELVITARADPPR